MKTTAPLLAIAFVTFAQAPGPDWMRYDDLPHGDIHGQAFRTRTEICWRRTSWTT
jgi:hypothetical protein